MQVEDLKIKDKFTWKRNSNKPNSILSAPGEDFIKEKPLCEIKQIDSKILCKTNHIITYCDILNINSLSSLMQLYMYQQTCDKNKNSPTYNLYKFMHTWVSFDWLEVYPDIQPIIVKTIDRTRYPNICPKCKHPAYIGINDVDCSNCNL
jgi:hypothetical protein